ncbi:SH3 domain-containing protein [Oceanicaulis sp.]|uniref:SH3 domain-containing protein n=1 Tax=Oceanicaulis sp. TaxID=1924941 RepID=UPI003F6EC0DA
MRTLFALIIIACAGLGSGPAYAQSCDTFSGLPVPRFVSLKYNETRGRAGPSFTHPVAWLYQRQGLPMEVVAETPDWRRVRDPQGEEVWMHRRTLTGRRSVWTQDATQLLARPDSDAALIADVEAGAVLWLERCRAGWCRLEADDYRGWAPAEAFWGVYSEETEPSPALEGGQASCYRSSPEPDVLAADRENPASAD